MFGEALAGLGVYSVDAICGAQVRVSRYKSAVYASVGVVLGDPDQWLDEAFRSWMGEPAGCCVGRSHLPKPR